MTVARNQAADARFAAEGGPGTSPADSEPYLSPIHMDAEPDDEAPRRSSRARKKRPIEILLRSSPAGAVAAVDGVPVGTTPSLWQGTADSTPREFSFVLPGYALARYRFVPTQSGILHGRLEPIKAEPEAGARSAGPVQQDAASGQRKTKSASK